MSLHTQTTTHKRKQNTKKEINQFQRPSPRHTHTHTHTAKQGHWRFSSLELIHQRQRQRGQAQAKPASWNFLGAVCRACALLQPNTRSPQKKKNVRKESEQIVEDRAEPQQIVATRPLYCLQHPLPIQVVCKRFFPAHIVIAIHELDSRPFRPLPVTRQLWYTSIRDALFLLISYKRDQHHRFQHRFWLRGVQPLSSVW